jgi:hypothetical protein
LPGQEWRFSFGPFTGAEAFTPMKASIPSSRVLILLALTAAAWLLPGDARAADENDAPTLILQGRKLQAAGKTNEAEARWRAALELDPVNTAARDYLLKLGHTNFPPPKPLLPPGTPPDSRMAPSSVPLHTRWFKIDPNTFMANLSGSMRMAGSRTNGAVKSKATGSDLLLEDIRRYLEQAGVDLQPPKSVIYSDTRGMLMARASLQDLDLIEKAVQVLNMSRPQVLIDVKFCEVSEDPLRPLPFDLFVGFVPPRSFGTATNAPAAAATGPQRREVATNAPFAGLTGILTPDQYRVVLRALEQREGVKIIAAPSVITLSGRQAQMKTVDVRTVVTGLDLTTNRPPEPGQPPQHEPITEPFELGPVVDVVPLVGPDGRTIQLTVVPSIKEFIGYDLDSPYSKDIWDIIEPPFASPPSQLDVIPQRSRLQTDFLPAQPRPSYPLPIFRDRQIVSNATVSDGQTLVLSTRSAKTGPPDNHPANKLPKEALAELSARVTAKAKAPTKTLFVFITPTIVDAAGNRVHTDDEIPARNNSVPPPTR